MASEYTPSDAQKRQCMSPQAKNAQEQAMQNPTRRSARIAAIPKTSQSLANTKQHARHLSNKRAREESQELESYNPTYQSKKRRPTQKPLYKKPSEQIEKPKRLQEEDTPVHYSQERSPKRARELNNRAEPLKSITSEDAADSWERYIGYWVRKNWPKAYFEGEFEYGLDDYYKMHHPLARKGTAASHGAKMSASSLTSFGASDERPRGEKSAPYRNPDYPTLLFEGVANYKSYMTDHELGVSDASEKLLQELLDTEQSSPKNTLFDDNVLKKHLEKLKGKNESRILQDLSPLLVPSAEALATLGADHLVGIVESVNEGWNNCFPITKSCPQPDSAFGCGARAFSDDQLDKLRPTLGDASFSSYFKTTYYMLFPFMVKEAQTGNIGLGVADNQNLHSATIAVRAVVELFKVTNREKELHREIVALAISHDDKSVRLYAHYPYIDGDKVTIWRRTVDQFFIDAKTKWRTRTFSINCFNIFFPKHVERIRSVIDDISDMTSLLKLDTGNS